MKSSNLKEYFGEFFGTFIIVLFGCSSVAAAVTLNLFDSLFEIAVVWGIGVTIAIYLTKNYSKAHLNPAVTIGFWLNKDLEFNKVPIYIFSQLLGGILGGIAVLLIFNDLISLYEINETIVRGSEESYKSAVMFGEFYPNPGFEDSINISWLGALLLEALGTFILMFVIFKVTEPKRDAGHLAPIIIGATITILICLIAPFTQAGFNPARDFGPRLVAYFSGWGDAAFPIEPFSFFTVYILGPIAGAIAASGIHKLTR